MWLTQRLHDFFKRAPDDPPFPTTAPAAIPPGPGPDSGPAQSTNSSTADDDNDPKPDGNGNALPGGLTPEVLQTLTEQIVSPLKGQIDQLQTQNRDLQARLEQRDEPMPPSTGGDDDFLTRFSGDPEGTVKSTVQDTVRSTIQELSPLFSSMIDVANTGILAGHQTQIDTQFGAGTWEKEFAPVLQPILDNARQRNPELLSNRAYLDKEVAALKGWKMDQLVQRREEFGKKTAEDRERERQELVNHLTNTTNLPGGLRPPGAEGREPTQAEKDYIALRREKSGVELDAGGLRRSRLLGQTGAGTSFEDWKKAQTAAKGKDS